jgi:uncharacterized membrane protein
MLLRCLSLFSALALAVMPLCGSAADDPNDPLVAAQASALGRDPQRIYAFVRDEIGLEIYSTSLRGARGVLQSRSGNPLDRASLLVALLRASGQTARYVQGTLNSSLQAAVISAMFAPRNQILGCLPPGVNTSNPVGSGLNGQLNPHFWVEYGGGNTPLDPTLRTNQAGQTYGTAASRFTEIPEALRQKVTVRLVTETYNAAGALFGLGVGTATVLEQTFETAAVYGKPISIGHFVSTRALAGPTASANIYTYSPYLTVGDPAGDVRQQELIRGTDFQESLTNYPLSSIILTGLFLEVDAEDRNEQRRTYRKTILDRIGIAARRNGGRISVSPGDLTASISEQDITTVNILGGLQGPAVFAQLNARLQAIQTQVAAIQPQLAALPQRGPLSPAQLATMQEGTRLARAQSIVLNELNTSAFARAADRFLQQLQTGYLVRGWYNRPRILVGTSRYKDGTIVYGLDLVKRDMQTIAEAGQRRDATAAFELLRGLIESSLEGEVLAGSSGQTAFDVIDVIRNATDGLTVIGRANLPALADLTAIPAGARELINEAVSRGVLVILPRRPVTLGGAARFGWLEYDPVSGETISSFEDGSHGAFVDYVGTQLVNLNYTEKIAEFCGRINGIGISGIIYMSGVLNGVAGVTEFNEEIKHAKEEMGSALGQQTLGGGTPIGDALKVTVFDAYKTFADESLFHPPPLPESAGLVLAFAKGLYEGFKFAEEWLKKNLPDDPEVYPFLGADLVNGVPGPVAPGTTPDTRVTLLPDPLFFTNIGGAELPSVYKFRVQNLGPAAQTYSLSTGQGTAGVEYQFSVDRITVPAGQTMEVGLCVVPRPPVAAAGTAILVRPQANAEGSGVQTGAAATLTVPPITAVSVRTAPAALTLRPGASATVDLTVQNTGNQAVTGAALSLAAAPGLTVTGLPGTVNVPVGETATIRVTVTAAPSTAFNAGLAVAFRALSSTWILPVGIGTDAGNCAVQAGAEASSSGRSGLATVLNELARRLNTLAGTPDDAALRASTIATLNNVIGQLDVPSMLALRPAFEAAQEALRTATAGGVGAAINTLGAELCKLRETIAQLPGESFQTILSPTAQIALPGTNINYSLLIENTSARTRTFRLSTSTLPPGVAASFNTPNLTLRGGSSSNAFQSGFAPPVLTLTVTGALAPFRFEVLVTAVDDPNNPQRLPASVATRPELVAVDSVTATPPSTAAGGIVALSARVLNVSNQTRTGQLFYHVYNAANQIVRFNVFGGEVALGLGSALQTFTLTQPVNTTGLPDGPYRVEVWVTDGGVQLNPQTARGSFFVGLPVSASVSVTPNTMAPPSGTTTARLEINRDATANPLATLVGSVQTTGRPQNMAILNNIVYVCGDTAITAVDVSNPANLVVRRTFGQAQLGTVGYGGTPCNIANNHLYVLYSRLNGNQSAAFLPTNIAVYNLADPVNPAFVTVKQIERQDAGTLAVNGTVGTTTTQGIFFNPFSRFIFQYHGQVITLDLSDPANPREISALFPPALADPRLGSPNPVAQTLPINSTYTYVASSTMTTDPNAGVGRVVIANFANPAAPAVASTLEIPGTRLIYNMARLGNTVLLLGDTRGNYDADSGLTGFLTLTALDITNPAAPVIRQTLTTQLLDKDGASALALTNSTFVVGGATLNDKPLLLLVDAANPAALRYLPYEAPVKLFPQRNAGSFFYALSDVGLATYRLDTVAGPQLTARVEVPKGTGVAVVPGSFSLAPTNVIAGTEFDTYEWVQPAPNTITWNMNLTGLAVGAAKTVIRGGRVDFTLPTFGAGSFPLPAASVMTDQILSMTPAERVGNAGAPSTFAVTLRNPLPTAQTFNLAVSGVAPEWVNLPPTVTVAANTTANFNLVITPDQRARQFLRYQFVLTAQTQGGISGNVAGQVFVISAGSAGGNAPPSIVAVNAALLPPNVVVGRSGQATTTLRLENTGNVNLDIAMGLEAPGFYRATLSRNGFTLRPGRENAEEVTVSFTANPLAAAGPFRIFANNLDLTGNLTVLPQGVALALTPSAGLTTTAFAATVTNTGTAADTFDLAPAGALGPVVTVTPNTVTLAPGASTNVALAIGNAASLIPGATSFDLIATSRANAAARTQARATVNVPGVKGVLAALDPSPAATALTLSVNNTGNGDDEYSVRVSGTTGTAAATLRDLATNQPVTAIARMTLQGLGLGQLPVATTGAGTVTITVQSLSDPAIQSVATATVGSPVVEPPPVNPPPVTPPPVTPNQAPVSRAGANRDVPIRRVATLDGRASADPDNRPQPLTYAWTLLSKPNGSQLATAGIANAGQAVASFTPDAFGEYTFRLTVSDGAMAGTSEVVIRCVNQLPVADAGPDVTTLVNRTVILQGDQSFDPDGDRISYAWRLLSAPAGSAVTTVRNSWTVQPYFIPDRPGTYRFSLTVRDGLAESPPDVFEVQAYGTNPPASPARTPAARSVFPAPITGPAAAAPAVWRIVSVARDSRLNEADVNNGRFVPDAPGFYVLRREVEGSATNFVFVSAAACDTDADGAVNELDLQLLIGLFGSATAPEVLACSAPPPVTVPERPYFSAEPRLIQLTWQRGTPLPEARTVFLDGDVAEFRVTVVGRGFVTPTPAQGSLPTNDRVALRFSPGALAPGIYEDQVVFVPSGGAESVIVRVLLTVIDTPQLLVDQRPLLFRYRRGGAMPAPQTLYVTATAKPIRFEAGVATGTWLMVNPGVAQIPANLRVEVDPRTLAVGTYNGLIRVSSAEAANSPKEVPVTLIVE